MNSNQNLPNNKSEEIDATLSVDEFFRELEEREKDLHITDGLVIEIDETGGGNDENDDLPEFLQQEFPAAERQPKAQMPQTAAPHDFSSRQQAASPSTASTSEAAELENKIANLQNQISKLETERVEMFETARRRQTDLDNYKKRVERERGETFRAQLGNLATQMLPVLDNLNRALDSISGAKEDENQQNFGHFRDGIMLVGQQLGEILEEMGVQPIVAVGEVFDPHFHEAVATDEATGDVPPFTITAELLRGYRIDDRVIRPSMVKVSK
ncbi:MAG: nucleotide exchange factor GrpE [Acidobacteria bacterium]|jgi:molecular chaperone GrpE|nr:nucleotide exchange factor GrpE [Acidobacteriota bacterium]